MAKNEVGEFELVLGNRQLLSVFFIVVTLLGVFFFMGYILGRNSSPPSLDASLRKPDKTTIIDSPNATPPTKISPATSPATTTKAEPPPESTETKAAEPPERASEEKKKKPEPPKEDKKAETTKSKPEPKTGPAPAVGGSPASGTYLQLAAVPKAEAELLISVLRKKGFSAASGPGPAGSDLFRVLVGPLTADAIPETRVSLSDAGMPGAKALVRKY
jgi:outer membrane biosynthesis protein TonB